MKRNHRLAGGFLLLFLLSSLIVLMLLSNAEPVHRGRPLSAWAAQYGSNKWGGGGANPGATVEAEQAINQIGTNSMPYLFGYLRVQDSALKKSLRTVVPSQWHPRLHLLDDSWKLRRIGAYGFAALGTNGGCAVPGLLNLATNLPDEDGRYVAVFALRTLGTAAEPALPFFIECLTNQAWVIRSDAVIALGGFQHRADVVVTALVKFVEWAKTSPHAHASELSDAVFALGQFGPDAKPAIPTLLPLLTHEDSKIREQTTNSLRQIESQILN